MKSIEVDGVKFDQEQARHAIRAAVILVEAYEVAAEENGGGSSVDWETLDMAFDQALRAIPIALRFKLIAEAKTTNGVGA